MIIGCTNMACVGLPYDAYHVGPNNPTIGPPNRPGMFDYRPGRGRVVDPSGKGHRQDTDDSPLEDAALELRQSTVFILIK